MDRFIRDENLRHYRRLLQQTSDPVERERIHRLLAEEEAKGSPTSQDGPSERLNR
jgi:hypothetical protein